MNDLVDNRSPMGVVIDEDFRPELGVFSSHQISRLVFEERIFIAHINKLIVAHSALVSDAREVGVALFAVLSDDARVIEGIFAQKALRVVIGIDIDFGQSVVSSWFLIEDGKGFSL